MKNEMKNEMKDEMKDEMKNEICGSGLSGVSLSDCEEVRHGEGFDCRR